MYRSIRFQMVLRSKPVFNKDDRQLIAIIDLIDRKTQPVRIDLPAPVRSFQIRILRTAKQIA